MKQLLQSIKTGKTELATVPCPAVGRGQLLIATSRSLVSAGTERMLIEFGKAGVIGKIRQQPDKIRMVIDKIKTDGLAPTLEAVMSKLDQPLPMGYSNVGVVAGLGEGARAFAVGDRVVSNGKHAETVSVPINLCAKVPDGVSDDEAAFTVIAAIGLQGIRLAQPTLGEAVVVTGLGLIGLVTVQLLLAQGCRVLGIDFDAQRIALAERFGAIGIDASREDPVAAALAFSRGRGVDAVIVTAATSSSEPIHQAALMSRKRGRIVLVGTAGLELSRADFYEKELTFQVSCSYGPGRYDPVYEQSGFDYPIGFVRWTEQRNLEAVLDMMADRRLDVTPLISHRFPIAEAERAYELVADGTAVSLGILLDYGPPDDTRFARTVQLRVGAAPPAVLAGRAKATVGFIGAGNYATNVLMPAFKAAGARLRSVASTGGASGAYAARKFGFEETTTDTERLFADAELDAVVIATRHDSHAALVGRALAAGKHVFVEKPLAMTLDELLAIEQSYDAATAGRPLMMMVGFNRRFAPHVAKVRSLLSSLRGEKKSFVYTVNAGAIPPGHWTQDAAVGGGRILGEACHFVDLLRFLAGAEIEAFSGMGARTATRDTATLLLRFADGSTGAIHYLANGAKSFPKERLEVFAGGRVLQIDNFRRLTAFGWPGFKSMKLWRQDKGHRACAAAFVAAVKGEGPAPIPIGELLEVSRCSVQLARALEGSE